MRRPLADRKKTKKNNKDSQLVIRINGRERDEFVSLCESLDTSAARELRSFIKSFVREHKATDKRAHKKA